VSELTYATLTASVLAWLVVLVVLVLLAGTLRHGHPFTHPQAVAVLVASLTVAFAGGLTALLAVMPLGTFDMEVVRWVLAVARGIGAALYLGVLLDRTTPLRRWLR
jgi:hypothetical protein